MTEKKQEIIRGLMVYTDTRWTNNLVITLIRHMKANKKDVPRYSYILGFMDGIEAEEKEVK